MSRPVKVLPTPSTLGEHARKHAKIAMRALENLAVTLAELGAPTDEARAIARGLRDVESQIAAMLPAMVAPSAEYERRDAERIQQVDRERLELERAERLASTRGMVTPTKEG